MPFFPNYILRDVLAWYVVIAVLAALAAFYPWELGTKADPFAAVPPGIRPEWYFLAMFHTLKLLPGGQARATKLTTLTVGSGASRQEVTAWSITGVGTQPIPIWSDARGKFFGFVFFLSWLPEQYASEHTRLNEAQTAALAAQAPTLLKSLVKVPGGAVAFTHVRVFDAEARSFHADQTVVVDKGKIASVGPAASARVPAGAQRVDGRGRTLVPEAPSEKRANSRP